jgi:ABC-type transporter Mla MlaB component
MNASAGGRQSVVEDEGSAGAGFRIWGPIRRQDLPGMTERVCAVLTAASGNALACDVTGVAADAVCVEALARLQLAARRKGCVITLRHAAPELVDLVAFLGLGDVLRNEESGVEPGR